MAGLRRGHTARAIHVCGKAPAARHAASMLRPAYGNEPITTSVAETGPEGVEQRSHRAASLHTAASV